MVLGGGGGGGGGGDGRGTGLTSDAASADVFSSGDVMLHCSAAGGEAVAATVVANGSDFLGDLPATVECSLRTQ